MKEPPKTWQYFDVHVGAWIGPLTLDELDAARKAATIEDYTQVVNAEMIRHQGPRCQGIPYHMIPRINIAFTPTIEEFRSSREGKLTTVLSGPNNCGKTLLLKIEAVCN